MKRAAPMFPVLDEKGWFEQRIKRQKIMGIHNNVEKCLAALPPNLERDQRIEDYVMALLDVEVNHMDIKETKEFKRRLDEETSKSVKVVIQDGNIGWWGPTTFGASYGHNVCATFCRLMKWPVSQFRNNSSFEAYCDLQYKRYKDHNVWQSSSLGSILDGIHGSGRLGLQAEYREIEQVFEIAKRNKCTCIQLSFRPL